MIKDILNKKLIVLLMGAGLTMTSCFNDDSKEGEPISDINIADFEESTYTRVSYMGQKLEINPSIETGYPESDLEYLWTVVPVQDSYSTSVFEQPVEISTEKNLSYEVQLAPNTYTVCLKVSSKSNGYTVSKTAKLIATTQFSQALYILKETEDGNSDLDLLLLTDGTHSENLLSQTREEGAMKGKPVNLTVAYSHNYINTETNKIAGANIICVVTDNRKISAFRSTDLKEIFNQDNMFYDTFGADEIPYGIQNEMNSTHYFSNKGVASVYTNATSKHWSGKYGLPPTETGGSVYMAAGKSGSYMKTNMSVFYWDQDGHNFYQVDYNGTVKLVTEENGNLLALDNYECIGSGYNTKSGTLFIMQDKTTKDRVVYYINDNATLKTTYPIDSSKHIAKSDIVRLNGQQAYYLYSVDDNKLYGYNWTSGDEIEMPLQGIGSGETINYVSNQYINPGAFASMKDKFDYLVIGTTTGSNDYHLYLYKMVGGQPDGEPVLKTSGTGRVNNVRYVTPSFSTMIAMLGNWVISD